MLDSASRGLVYLLVFLFPIFALPVSLDPLEVNKQTLLVLCSAGAFVCWAASMVVRRKFELRAGWLVSLPLVVLVATVLSAFRSSSPYLSWIGTDGQEYLSVLTTFSLTLLYFVIVNRVTGEKEHRVVHALLVASAVVAGAIGLGSAFSGSTFNTVGTLNALGVYLSGMCVFGCGLLVASRPDHALFHAGRLGSVERGLVYVLAAETLVLLLALNYVVLWAVLLSGLSLLFLVALLRATHIHDPRRFLLPFALIAVSVAYALGMGSPFHLRLPVEVTPSFSASVDIARDVLSSPSGLLGSGPGTFAFDYALLHDASVNATSLWGQRFDRGASFVLTVAPALGMLGLIAWTLFLLAFFVRGGVRVLGARAYADWAAVLVDLGGWVAFAVAAFLYPGNMTSVFFLFVLGALLGSQVVKKAAVGTFDGSPKLGLFFVTSVMLASLGVLTALFVGTERYISEIALSEAVRLAGQNAPTATVVSALDRAVRFNRFNDAAERDLAQSLLQRVGEEIRDLKDISTVAPETAQYIQALAAASVNASVAATDLSPRNPVNWLARASVYRELIPLIGNAGDAAVEAHRQAIALEPQNPSDQVELGKTYLALADALQEATKSKDAATSADAKARRSADLASAEAAFNAAIALKSDYAPAHYQLAVVYEQQGRLDDAVGKLESVAKYNPLDVGVAFELGTLYLRRDGTGDLALAQRQFETAVGLVPTYANARWLLASIYEKQGSVAQAIEQVKKVLEYNQDNDIVKQRLQQLQTGGTSAGSPETIE